MESAPRYEIIDEIARGDFATVYRARDRELGREVAIKQIHQQFLDDKQQLARYWQEAQLLASLQHPNIITVYDIVRSRGWLIMELMRGSLQPATEGDGIDLNYLRSALSGCLGALQFLHGHGVIHGDVKPSNLLVDRQNRVKLGDFGLARRASNEEGSLLKGTTKYMAPELVAEQFGQVGPASDLYSLGFAAYELMCGNRFDSLFPGLGSFGRDRQIAWMMWHAAADRNLPPISRVLEGVPPDLTAVIERMVVKDQSRRYQSAHDVLADLRAGPATVDHMADEEDPAIMAGRIAAEKRKKRIRLGAIGAICFSLLICVVMLLPEKEKKQPTKDPKVTYGVITEVLPGDRMLTYAAGDDKRAVEIKLTPQDRIFINNDSKLLRHLEPGDTVEVERFIDETGRRIFEIRAARPLIESGRIKVLAADIGKMTVALDGADEDAEGLVVTVPEDVKIVFNGNKLYLGEPVTVADLRIDDRVTLRHERTKTGRQALDLDVQRVVTSEGVLRDINKKQATFAVGEGESAEMVTLPMDSSCDISINHRSNLGGRIIKPDDLKPGDKVTIAHDKKIVRLDAYRVLGTEGVVRAVRPAAGMLEVTEGDDKRQVTYIIGKRCEITLGGEPVELTDLRTGDIVDVSHDTPDAERPAAVSVSARRPADPNRWALLIATGDYEDISLSKLTHPVADARMFRDVLVGRYRVPPEQALLLVDESLVRLEQGIPALLGKLGEKDKVVLYYAGHAYKNNAGKVYLAPKNYNSLRVDSSGLKLQWLVDQLESCKAGGKLLLLDACNDGTGDDLVRQPSTAAMLETLESPAGMAPLRTVTAVASCSKQQRGKLTADGEHGLFAAMLGQGFAGKADKNRDNWLEPTELFGFLGSAMSTASSGAQTPALFLPDDRPPRLSPEAKKQINKLAAYLRQDRIDLAGAKETFAAAESEAGSEIEPKLIYGLLLMKSKQREDALAHFEELKINHASNLLPIRAVAWLSFEKRSYIAGIDGLIELVSKIPKPKKADGPLSAEAKKTFHWIGQLREFSATAALLNYRPNAQLLGSLDKEVAEHGPAAVAAYDEGREKIASIVGDYDSQIASSTVTADAAKLKVERRRLVNYAEFPFDEMKRRILAGLDQ